LKPKHTYYYIHLIHAILILVLLATGSFLYVPALRTFLGEYRYELRQFHSIIGISYFIFLCFTVPSVFRYARAHRRWQKTFHICLQLLLGVGWTASGIYLWLNYTEYLGIRQASILLHDALTLFIIPWVSAHILLWYIRRNQKPVRKEDRESRDRGILISRRDVLLLFSGAILAFMAGGLFRWFQPLSPRFLNALETVKRKGYFRIYSVRSDNPVFNRGTWRLTVDGLVEKPASLSFDELINRESHTFTSDFHCVTGWSVNGVKWKGISFRDIINQVKPGEEGAYVRMYSADRLYTETYELTQLLEENVILAYELEGKPLSENQGAPLRLFHPNMYGYKSIKWLNRIEVVKDRGLGYWEEKEGYDLNGYLR
jgi:methionine sulfoxide reductase catalytic subunit